MQKFSERVGISGAVDHRERPFAAALSTRQLRHLFENRRDGLGKWQRSDASLSFFGFLEFLSRVSNAAFSQGDESAKLMQLLYSMDSCDNHTFHVHKITPKIIHC